MNGLMAPGFMCRFLVERSLCTRVCVGWRRTVALRSALTLVVMSMNSIARTSVSRKLRACCAERKEENKNDKIIRKK